MVLLLCCCRLSPRVTVSWSRLLIRSRRPREASCYQLQHRSAQHQVSSDARCLSHSNSSACQMSLAAWRPANHRDTRYTSHVMCIPVTAQQQPGIDSRGLAVTGCERYMPAAVCLTLLWRIIVVGASPTMLQCICSMQLLAVCWVLAPFVWYHLHAGLYSAGSHARSVASDK